MKKIKKLITLLLIIAFIFTGDVYALQVKNALRVPLLFSKDNLASGGKLPFLSRFQQGAFIEFPDYGDNETVLKGAKHLTELLSNFEQGKFFLRLTNASLALNLYTRIPINTKKKHRKDVHWLIYGGSLNRCIKSTIGTIMQNGREQLTKESVTLITLPLFAINARTRNVSQKHHPIIYSGPMEIADLPELLAQKSLNGRISSGNGFDIAYDYKYRIIIRKNGEVLKVVNQKGGPTFVLDFYTTAESMYADAFEISNELIDISSDVPRPVRVGI